MEDNSISLAQDRFSVGDIIADKFRLEEIIGRGTAGAVFKGRDIRQDILVAIKILSRESMGDEGSVRRFLREGRILENLRHPNTVFFFDSGLTEAGLPFLAMEYVDGKSLAEVLQEKKKFSPEVSISIAIQALQSLQEAHALGYVHRDIKPGNIMLCAPINSTEVGYHVKVLDFGISTLTGKDDQDDSADRTCSLDVVGTPMYMAPELFRSDPLTSSSDLYAIGCILYEMLTGEKAFDGDSLTSTMALHLFTPAPTLPEEFSCYPTLNSTLANLFEKDPKNRLPDAKAVIRLLKKWNAKEDLFAQYAEKNAMTRSSDLEDALGELYSEKEASRPSSVVPFSPTPTPAQTPNPQPTTPAFDPTSIEKAGFWSYAFSLPECKQQLKWVLIGLLIFLILGFALAFLLISFPQT